MMDSRLVIFPIIIISDALNDCKSLPPMKRTCVCREMSKGRIRTDDRGTCRTMKGNVRSFGLSREM